MSTDLKVVLTGFLLILSSLFFMGICIINDGALQGLTLALFIIGIIVSIVGLFFCKEKNKDEKGK